MAKDCKPLPPEQLERPDKMEFQVNQPVKVSNNGRWYYYLVLEDNRFKKHCTHTYTLIPPGAKPEKCPYSGDMGITVYCHYPKDIHPVTKEELVLFF